MSISNTHLKFSTPSTFRPAWWLSNPHLQTLWPVLIRKLPLPPHRRERLELPDGDFIELVWVPGDPQKPLVIILHGLEGSLYSPYVKGILHAIHQQHWCGVLMHFRGCHGGPNRLPRSYHSGETGDLAFLVRTLPKTKLSRPLFAIGYSLGGNVLLKWLGEQGSQASLTAAAAVSVPFELNKVAVHIEKSLGGFYQWWLLRHMKRTYQIKFKEKPGPVSLAELPKLKTFHAFDNKITAPLHDFVDVDDYYQQASSRQFLSQIRIPTLIIHALDDPFMCPTIVPTPEELSNTIHMELTQQGGHVGFVSGRWPWQAEYWLETRIMQYFQKYLG